MSRSNREAFADRLIELARTDGSIVVLASDSRGSAALSVYAQELPEQFVEVGIAEQNLVGIAAGMATCGKKAFACSPACFLSMRSIEQIKVDVAYSDTNVKLIGISGGVSYGALGSTHHSLQDIAVMRAIPGITVIVPSDNIQTKSLADQLVRYKGPTYVRLGRNPVPDVHGTEYELEIGKGHVLTPGEDVSIIACGELVAEALGAGEILNRHGVSSRVIEMHTVKPLDKDIVLAAALETSAIVTVEEHSVHGGLGSAVAEFLAQQCPVYMRILAIPDESVVNGTQKEILDYYGLSSIGIAKAAIDLLERTKPERSDKLILGSDKHAH